MIAAVSSRSSAASKCSGRACAGRCAVAGASPSRRSAGSTVDDSVHVEAASCAIHGDDEVVVDGACEVPPRSAVPVVAAAGGVTASSAEARSVSLDASRADSSAADGSLRFLALLPGIRARARKAFRELPAEARDEAVAEAVANAFVAFARLVELGKEELAYPGPLARFAIAQVRAGRRVGTAQNVRDVLSAAGQFRRGQAVERLDRFDAEAGEWQEILVEDRRCTPAEIAAMRIDFAEWLDSLTSRQRRMAEVLATGERTQAVAQRFRVTYSAVSEMRRRLREAWERFQGEVVDPVLAPA